MRFAALFLGLAFLLQPTPLPPELPPIIPPEVALRAWGFYFEDTPASVADGEPVTITQMCVTASGVSTTLCTDGINRLNNTSRNSAQGHVTWQLVRTLPTTYVSSGASSTDLSRISFSALTTPGLEQVPSQRDLYAADTVVLIGTSGDSCGVAYLNSSASSAFAYVMNGCISNSSYEHEVGHNIGMQHDRPNVSGGATSLATNFGWCFGNGYKDVLTYPSPCGGSRAPFYSNPDVLYNGVPTGTAQNNNAAVLRARAGVIANFRLKPLPPPPTNHRR